MTTMTDEQLAAIRARCSAVPDTKLIMLDSDNDLFDELAIHMVRDQLLVGEIAWLNKDDVSRAYGEIFAHARADIPALLAYIDELLAEVERLRADAELGRLVREVLPLMAVEPPANHHTALICWGGSGWDVFYACDDWSLPDTAPSTTPEDALRSARENMEQHRMLVGYYPDFRAAEAQT